jgi:tryptophanyl-tRNA synthetase
MKKTMITGVQPTGNFTLANYIGAIKNFVKMQSEHDSYIFIADLHGLTTYQDPQKIHKTILDLAALYIACGVDAGHTKFFVQSDVNEHSALGYLMAFQCRVGELSRMTQYKSKSKKMGNGGIDLGLFIYPTLMAADILLYDAAVVPVGDDQRQHIEMTRDLGERFNKRYGETFILPDYYIPKVGARILNLQNPMEKMSKSAPLDDKGTIFILDDINITKKKIMSAVTDSESSVRFDLDNKPGISNLISIMSIVCEMDIKDIEEKYKSSNYGAFKKDLAEAMGNFILPIQDIYNHYRSSDELMNILENGKVAATSVAEKKLKSVRERMGIHK